MHSAIEWFFLLGAGLVAGVVGTAGGITSLVAYPALLAVGIPPLAANVTNSVALLGSGFGSAVRAGPDIDGHSQTFRTWLPPTVLFSFLRIAIAACGIALAVWLFVERFTGIS